VLNKFTKFLLVGLLILGLVGAAAGCGGKDSGDTIVFVGSGGYPPFNFINEKDEVIGFDVDVAAEIADRLGMTLDYQTSAWDGLIEGLRAGRFDGILGSMAITAEREEQVDFSIPYYYSGAQLIVKKDSGISAPEDLAGDAVVGLVTGTTFEEDAANLGVEAQLYEDDNQTLMELVNGRVDGVITDRVVGLNAIAKINGGDQLTLAGDLMRKEMMAVAFQQDDPLKDEVDKVLQEMHEDGTLSEISAKWFNGEDITKQ